MCIRDRCKGLEKQFKTPKVCGPKFKNKKSYGGVKFWRWLRFSRNWWTLVHIFRRCWKALGKGYKPTKFCGPKSRNKKLFGDQILNFGPDFLEIGELWSTYFGILRKPWRRATRRQNFVDQSSKTKKLWKGQILNFGPDFCETSELWSTFFGISGKIPERLTTCQNFVGQSSKTTKLCDKNRKIMGVGHFGGNCTLFHQSDPRFFWSFLEVLWTF